MTDHQPGDEPGPGRQNLSPEERERLFQQELEHLRKQTEQLERQSHYMEHQSHHLEEQTRHLEHQSHHLEEQTRHLEHQSHHLEEQTRHLERQSEFLEAIKGHFIPDSEAARERRWRQYLAGLTVKVVAAITALLAIQQLSAWLFDQWQIRRMAGRYAEVARTIYYDENNPEVAYAFLDHAIELQPNNPEYRYMRGYIDGMAVIRKLLNLDRPLTKAELDQAHQALAQALFLKSLSDRRPEPYILQGQVHVALKLYEQAFADLSEAIRLDPRNDYAHLRLGMLLVEQGKADPGLKEIDVALALNPKSKWAWLWRGIVVAEKKQDLAAARAAYDKALALDPRFDMAWYNAAWTWMSGAQKDYKKAREMMERALAINPDYKEAYYGMGMVYGYQNLYDVASVYMSKAIGLDERFMTAWKWRGVMYGEMGKHEAALADFGKAIELDPTSAELYVWRAKNYERLGRLNEAIADLRFALERDAKDETTWLQLGNVFLKAGEREKALENYGKALAINKDYDDAYAQQSKVYMELGQPQKAIEAMNAALKVTHYRPERFHLQRGQIYQSTHDYEHALADIRKARELDPALAEAWLAEAELLKDLDRKAEALAALGRLIELQPENKTAQALRSALQPGVARP